MPLMLGSRRIALARTSTERTNKYGDRGQPCLTPHSILIQSLILPLFITQPSISQRSLHPFFKQETEVIVFEAADKYRTHHGLSTTGAQLDVPRDCRTFQLYASGCGWITFVCVFVFLLLKESDYKS